MQADAVLPMDGLLRDWQSHAGCCTASYKRADRGADSLNTRAVKDSSPAPQGIAEAQAPAPDKQERDGFTVSITYDESIGKGTARQNASCDVRMSLRYTWLLRANFGELCSNRDWPRSQRKACLTYCLCMDLADRSRPFRKSIIMHVLQFECQNFGIFANMAKQLGYHYRLPYHTIRRILQHDLD
jgi:hypothetical protein